MSPDTFSLHSPPGSPPPMTDTIAVIGAGLVGLAAAYTLADKHRARVLVLETEARVAAHQSGHNSGVVHSGLYYKPGSRKAEMCRRGREALLRFCEEHSVPVRVCGKLVVATREAERERLRNLQQRARENGLGDLPWLEGNEIHALEPHIQGLAALHVPHTGVVDFPAMARALSQQVEARNGSVVTDARVREIRRESSEWILATDKGEYRARSLLACAGLQADRVARLCGLKPSVRIVPFRGEFFQLAESVRDRVKTLVYPVPDPALPFLGIHLTRGIDDRVEAGPNALFALHREAYGRGGFSLRDSFASLSWPGFHRLAWKHWRHGWDEWRRARQPERFVHAVRHFLPDLQADDLRPHRVGIRALALDRKGHLVDDFHVLEGEAMVHVLNAPSPAATACLSIGEYLAQRVLAVQEQTQGPVYRT